GSFTDGVPLLGEGPRVELFRVRVDPGLLQGVLRIPSVSQQLAPLMLLILRLALAAARIRSDEWDDLQPPDYEELGPVPVVACVSHELLHLEAQPLRDHPHEPSHGRGRRPPG